MTTTPSASKVSAETPTGQRKLNPNPLIVSDPSTAINAVPPAGGCIVLVSCMATAAADTAMGAASATPRYSVPF